MLPLSPLLLQAAAGADSDGTVHSAYLRKMLQYYTQRMARKKHAMKGQLRTFQ